MTPLRAAFCYTLSAIGCSVFAVSAVWSGSGSSCVDCHQRAETVTALPAWYQDQFVHWYGSVHGQKGVTCERCHGGDASQTTKTQAHQHLRSSRDPQSPISYKNLPETCGTCHARVSQQFRRSRHYENLKADRLAPTCTTCHGFQMDVGGVTPAHIVGRCTMCHNPQQGVKPEVGTLAKQAVDSVVETEHALQVAQVALALAKERKPAMKDAEVGLRAARERLRRTGELWHNFRLVAFKQELAEIQKMAGEVTAAAKRAMLEQ